LIEDILAQCHTILDTLTFDRSSIALSALRTLSDNPGHGGPFAQLLGLEIFELESGRCQASIEVREHHLNPHGIAHGGVAYSLADSTSGGAALSVLDKPRMVTQDMQIRYHGPARPGKIIATAEVVHHGQRTVTTQCQVKQNGVLIASCTGTFAILSDRELETMQSRLAQH